MPRLLQRVAAAAALAAGVASCATAPVTPAALSPVAWPLPPEEPRLRLVAVLPDPAAPPPRRGFWRAALALVTGVERAEAGGRALARPFGVAFAAGSTLLVADPDAGRVVRFDARGTMEEVRCPGRGWGAPMAVVPEARDLLIADAGAGVVVRWSEGGCQVLGEGVLLRPTGVAVAGGRVWVADPALHQVVALGRDGSHSVVGRLGAGEGRFHAPSAVASDPDGRLLVVDTLNFRVVRLAADGSWLGSFGRPGADGDGFARPKGIAVGAGGTVYVSDAQRDEVLAFSAEGTFLWSGGGTGPEPGRLAHPAGLAISGGSLAVADSQNGRVQIFVEVGGSR